MLDCYYCKLIIWSLKLIVFISQLCSVDFVVHLIKVNFDFLEMIFFVL